MGPIRRLGLRKETIRALTTEELKNVVGASITIFKCTPGTGTGIEDDCCTGTNSLCDSANCTGNECSDQRENCGSCSKTNCGTC